MIGYKRVFTDDQNLALQHNALQAVRARGRKGSRQQKLTPQQIDIRRSLAADLWRSVTSICAHLEISRPRYYRYIAPIGEIASALKLKQTGAIET